MLSPMLSRVDFYKKYTELESYKKSKELELNSSLLPVFPQIISCGIVRFDFELSGYNDLSEIEATNKVCDNACQTLEEHVNIVKKFQTEHIEFLKMKQEISAAYQIFLNDMKTLIFTELNTKINDKMFDHAFKTTFNTDWYCLYVNIRGLVELDEANKEDPNYTTFI
jgi:hypothetical protein